MAMPSLVELLHAEIARNGPMPFRRFMELALYEPDHGYYASGRASIGRRGDFVTSVSVGPLFGRLLAIQFEEMWERLDRPARFDVVEQGANRGDFAHDVLSAAQTSPEFNAALHYRIIEPFPVNVERQRDRLSAFAGRITWHESLETLPPFTGVHFSNELVDALPVHLVVYRDGKWRERYVATEPNPACDCLPDHRLCWADGPLSTPALETLLPYLPPVEGYQTEINLEAGAWVESVAGRLERGYVLIADYGFSRADYYLAERTEGSLSCYREHRRYEDPLANPGAQDITAHVDFTTLAERAESAGLTVSGFTDQHHFLASLGRSVFPDLTEPEQLTPQRQKDLRAFATLMHPTLMGRGFQFLALGKNAPQALRGFELASKTRML